MTAKMGGEGVSLEALAVDDGRSTLVVLLLGDPHLLEGGERSQDGASDPYRVFPLGWSNDLDLHCGRSQGCDLLLHTVSNARVHGAASRENGVGVEILTDVDVTLHDGVVASLVDTGRFHTKEAGLEESLRASETLVANGDDLSVGQFVALLKGGARCGSLHLLFEVESNVAELLLDVTDDFTLGSGGEGVATLGEDLHEVVGQVTAGQVETKDGVGQGVSLVDGNGVGNTITRVENNTGGTSRGIEGKNSLDGNIHGWRVERLKHDLCHLLSVGLGVQGSLGQQYRVFLRGNTKLVVEGVMPDLVKRREI